MQFYAYLYLREDRTPYYAGKGSGKRAFEKKHHRVVLPPVKSLILVFPQESEADAFALEMALIRFFGRVDLGTGCLENRTVGGEGNAGFKWPSRTPAHLQKMRVANLGHPDYSTAAGIEKARTTKRTLAYRAAASAKQKLVWAARK